MSNPSNPSTRRVIQGLLVGAMLAWMAVWPPTLALGTALLLDDVLPDAGAALARVVLLAGGWWFPYLMVALATRRKPRWEKIAALAATLTAVVVYLVLNATLQALWPERPNRVAGGQLVGLSLYLLLAAWSAPRLAGRPRRSVWAWLGLNRHDATTWGLSLALAGLLGLPWAATGALGDRYVSLDIVFQGLAELLPLALLIWGLTFTLLTSAWESTPWPAALCTLLLYALALSASVIPHGDVMAIARAFLMLPLAFLLTELRARPGGVLPVMPVLLSYVLLPRLFVDPRDLAMKGLPETLHIFSHLFNWMLLGMAGMTLWVSRWLAREFAWTQRVPRWGTTLVSGTLALVITVSWAGCYWGLGAPGFHDDSFLILFEARADLDAAYAIPDREARIAYVYAALVETAEATQAPVRAELARRGWDYRPYYIINMIRVEGHRHRMAEFAAMPGVARVLLNPGVRPYPHAANSLYSETPAPGEGLQSNLTAINVTGAWDAGVTGESIVVAGQDTGYDWQHPALQGSYRGWDGVTARHDYSWHDAWDARPAPFDDDGHGTHTMGTIVGDDGGVNRIGVAPDARWIGCRNMRRGLGNPGSYAECMEFFLAPFPLGGDAFTQGDVALSPHVINNSWGCPPEEGCEADTLEPAVDALHAAGIMMVVSAGNSGPDCGSVGTPPAHYATAFSVGATNDAGYVTSFSSRGPADALLKPDISAPGSWVRSSIPNGRYGAASGTSMAGPHVAGLVALLWSANAELIGDIDATARVICETARPRSVSTLCPVATWETSDCACGGITGVPNNVYGCGLIQADAAVQRALELEP